MDEIKDYISIGLSPQTFEEILGTLETQLQSYDILIEKCQSIITANTNDKGVIKKGINEYKQNNNIIKILFDVIKESNENKIPKFLERCY